MSKILRAARDESGAIAIDWVVVTASVLILGLVAITALEIAI